MPWKRWSEEQIVYAVKQSEAGRTAAEICRELGVSEQTFYGSGGIGAWGYKASGAAATSGREPQIEARGCRSVAGSSVTAGKRERY